MRHIHLAAYGVAACALAACGGGIASPAPLPTPSAPPSAAAVAVPALAAPSPTSAGGVASATATSSPTTVPFADPIPPEPTGISLPPSGHVTPAGVALPADGPWTRVDGIPGVASPGVDYRLAVLATVYVHLPTVEDLSAGVAWTLDAESVPVLDGYLRDLVHRVVAGWVELGDGTLVRLQVLGDDRSDTTAAVGACWTAAEGSHRGWIVAMSADRPGGEWAVRTDEPMEDMCWFG